VLIWDISNEYRAVVMKIRIILAASILLLVSMQINASVIVDNPLDTSVRLGWNSNTEGQLGPLGQQIAESFSVSSATTANLVSWSGHWRNVNTLRNFDILFSGPAAIRHRPARIDRSH
jgi:hypothetical protein